MLFEKINQLAEATILRYNPKELKWMWGEALLMHALGLLEHTNEDDKYFKFIKQYVDSHIEKGYVIDQSDTLAPTLAAYYLFKKTKEDRYLNIVNEAIQYIKEAPKIIDCMPNHLGKSFIGKFYPRSIWVDSIMMYGVFTAMVAAERGDEELMNFAKLQPSLFAKYLQDPKEKLFYHSYWTKGKHTYPKKKIFWGRGNGWVVCALPMLIDYLSDGDEKNKALQILNETSKALLKYQREDGYFETVLNRVGKTYKESSATALIASGWLHGVRKGYLPMEFEQPALKALQSIVDDLEYKDGLLSMPYISAPTIPLQGFPYLGYKLTPRGNDWTYGLAALFFAGIQYKLRMDIKNES